MVLTLALVTVLLVGPGVGYLIWHAIANPALDRSSVVATATPRPARSSSAPSAAGLVPCPAAAPTSQHPLGIPGRPNAQQRFEPSLDFCGQGSAILPPGTALFSTGPQWGLGVAVSCPSGSAGADGMGVVLTVTEQLPDGSRGIDSDVQQGDWTDGTTAAMVSAGSYKLKVDAVSPSCVWHIDVYPAP